MAGLHSVLVWSAVQFVNNTEKDYEEPTGPSFAPLCTAVSHPRVYRCLMLLHQATLHALLLTVSTLVCVLCVSYKVVAVGVLVICYTHASARGMSFYSFVCVLALLVYSWHAGTRVTRHTVKAWPWGVACLWSHKDTGIVALEAFSWDDTA